MAKHLFTSESVTEGHPDKICDQISDAVLDAIMEKDPQGRVACETTCTTGQVLVMGEISTSCYVEIPQIVRKVICDIGYDSADKGFDGNTCAVLTAIDGQSPDIALGVDHSLELKNGEEDAYNLNGAGDQGMMFGYACDETPELMPLPISLAHKLTRRLTEVRKNGTLPYLLPDGKSQVTVEYDDNDRPVRVDTVVISSQHRADVSLDEIRRGIVEHVVRPVVPVELMDDDTIIYVNPTGRFVTGGPVGDSGLTGRKIIVDTYGGYAQCEIQLAYAIGVAKPVSVMVDTFGTGVISDDSLSEIVMEEFDLRPAAIIDMLDLRHPIYRQLAAYGHLGRTDIDLTWEKTDRAEALKKAAGIDNIA